MRDAVEVRSLVEDDAAEYHALRLRALREHPDAFTSSYEEDRLKPLAWARSRIAASPDAPHGFILGAFAEGNLVGILGLSIDTRAKVRHKGEVFGMYVAREHAGRGVGQALMTACIGRAKETAGLEQLRLTVTETNARAKSFYESAGFRSFGVERNAVKVDGRYFDKCHMLLDLHPPAS
jgi:RimJ/RimL family protein N-acetyltransferase